MNDIAFIGAGRVATTLSQALANAGWSVKAVASRAMESAESLASLLPDCQAVSVVEACQHPLVFLTVTDDAISSVCSELTWHTGQSVVHCSGATETLALESAAAQGAQVGGFHPLQIFSDPQSALRNLPGSSVAIEAADPTLATTLRDMANALGMHPFDLPAGSRSLYHAGAGYAASLLLPLLHEAVQLWRELGVDEAQALQALLPLAKGTLASVERRGLAGALSGPLSRGDLGVLQKHLDALTPLGDEHLSFYKTLTRRQWPLLRASKPGSAHAKQSIEVLLGKLPG
ncbi:MAG: DUF2520 domain-containing protein [Rhizobacter sp.]